MNMRLLIASVISYILIVLWQMFVLPPTTPSLPKAQINKPKPELVLQERDIALSANKRVLIENNKLRGSINLQGARFDDLVLTNYQENNQYVALFSPSIAKQAHFAEFGWVADKEIALPNANTLWQSSHKMLQPGQEIELFYINPQQIRFSIFITLDQDYLFTVKQQISNHGKTELMIHHYASLSRAVPSTTDNAILHEGPIAVVDNTLQEMKYLQNEKQKITGKTDWLGFSDKYWLTALAPQYNVKYAELHGVRKYQQQRQQINYISEAVTITPGAKHSVTQNLFVGAKELVVLDRYTDNIPLLDRAVDFGVLYFITKPIFMLLSFFYGQIGNFGWAIVILTVLIKILLLPIAYKGFQGMNRLKDLQPKLMALKEKYPDNPQALQKEMLALYQKEKVNPVSGCLPILLQIPIFFALYKVLYTSIEMRGAPFIGWIVDLSAPDPLTPLNLFGLLPWTMPGLLHIGVLPICMAFTMYVQQRLNPEPADPIQAKMMRLLPVIFLFMFSSFPAGLVLYWTWSNILSIAQQIWIKRITQ